MASIYLRLSYCSTKVSERKFSPIYLRLSCVLPRYLSTLFGDRIPTRSTSIHIHIFGPGHAPDTLAPETHRFLIKKYSFLKDLALVVVPSGATFIMLYHPKYNVARKQEPATLRTLYTAHDTAYG